MARLVAAVLTLAIVGGVGLKLVYSTSTLPAHVASATDQSGQPGND